MRFTLEISVADNIQHCAARETDAAQHSRIAANPGLTQVNAAV